MTIALVSEITSCEVCGAPSPVSVLDLGSHPLCDDLVPVNDSRLCEEYPIEILFCESCYTAHQRFQVAKQVLFPQSYHYRARFTADVLTGMAGLVTECESRLGDLKGAKVLDIGCNDGSLLNFFRDRGAVTIGIEPTSAFVDAHLNGHQVTNAFFDEEVARQIHRVHGSPTIVTFTNVFAHIANLEQVLTSLRILIDGRTTLVIENHYLGSILERNQFDTFYHEHPRSYSYRSFQKIAESLGLEIIGLEFPSRYGGNIRLFIGDRRNLRRERTEDLEASVDESGFKRKFDDLRGHMTRWRGAKRHSLSELVRQQGRLRAKAFPGRAAILIKLLGLDEHAISATFEKPGSMKIGHYVPGTRIPILSDEVLFSFAELSYPLLNLAWHISAEIRSYLQERGYAGQIVDIIDPDDFY